MKKAKRREVESPWLTIDEAAGYLNLNPGTVRNWVSERRIPCVRRGGVVRLHRHDLDLWLRAGECRELREGETP